MKHKKIMFWDDERDIGNSLIVTLNDGWRFEEDGLFLMTDIRNTGKKGESQ